MSNDLKGKVILSRAIPHESADKFCKLHLPTLIYFQEDWLSWNGSAYREIEDDALKSRVHRFLIDAFEVVEKTVKDETTGKKVHKLVSMPFDPKANDVSEVVTALQRMRHRESSKTQPPCWLDGRVGPNPKNIVSCLNGVHDIETEDLIDQTPEFFTRTALPIQYDFLDDCPRWQQFIKEVTVGDETQANLLQEAVGYLIASDTSQQRVFFLLGPPRSGKGTFLRTITALVGADNIHNPTIQSLASQFGMQPLPGKSVAIIGDATCHDKQKLSLAANRINGISGEDPQGIERKYKEPINVRLPTRFVIASNHLPDFGDHSAAIATRLLFLPFMVSFVGREDRQLEGKLLAELSGIFNWALEGLRRLRARGYFLEPNKCKALKTRMLYLSNPVRGFLDEWCVIEPSAATDKQDVYESYKGYCDSLGVRSLSLDAFAERLYELSMDVIKASKAPRSQGRRPIFVGLRLKDPRLSYEFDEDPDFMTAEQYKAWESANFGDDDPRAIN